MKLFIRLMVFALASSVAVEALRKKDYGTTQQHIIARERAGGVVDTKVNCWDICGGKQGPCDWCGIRGMCCMGDLSKHSDTSNGCDGSFGGKTMHECVDKPTKCDVSTQFTCQNGDCIPIGWKCDATHYDDHSDKYDCARTNPGDLSDELNCYCPDTCKCKSGGLSYGKFDGGKPVNGEGYCEYYCSTGGSCGHGPDYLSGTDCHGCHKHDCPAACKCESGWASDGGKSVNDDGLCEYFCSPGACGAGLGYVTASNVIDCFGCAA